MNGTIIVRAIGTIEKGEQLTIPYFPYYSKPNLLKSYKMQLVKEMGDFKCQCMACTYNWDLDPNQATQSFNDLTLTPMCFKCRTPKTVKPDKESKKCNKCKDVIDIKEVREMVQSLVLSSKIDASQLQITSRSRLVQDLTILQGLQAMTLPHTCRELIALRASMLYNLSRGDKCYVRPILRTDTLAKENLNIYDLIEDVLDRDVFEEPF
uniref:SET domain-containing protein n=1 Tax=Cacopsylla melanoneura TaxID=428564 RepID=A0A8D8VQR0_9HEMI